MTGWGAPQLSASVGRTLEAQARSDAGSSWADGHRGSGRGGIGLRLAPRRRTHALGRVRDTLGPVALSLEVRSAARFAPVLRSASHLPTAGSPSGADRTGMGLLFTHQCLQRWERTTPF